ncbi:ribbon-helix-helix protein, CopG family [Archaeoglobus profundus]|uniref:CopG domain protein DNA-binding domain protein n=1 Tax=Archaeoglobus profundus (strain DSM 5631 / JCM 9629 / NBRC 100127 / Av18) TaxID=572546 RepID=D2RFF6_ARCPA|nr:ribbon-helix-helix protein, CopG family [Archaeoglobus profundus]ADB58850.1 CopG domain protein DNA-binding domain protein [Archaeoglobus profundus DSM 5631]
MPEKIMRISVAVDENIRNIIEDLAKRENKTISDIIRQAISLYYMIKSRNLSSKALKRYLDILSMSDNIIVDLELWLAILDEINKHEDKEFWEIVERIGYEHGMELKSRGIEDIKDVLRILELKHLFKLKEGESNGNFTLVLATRNEANILKHYLRGLFKAFGVDVEFIEGLRKLIVMVKKK